MEKGMGREGYEREDNEGGEWMREEGGEKVNRREAERG
jgi:hypothetical protein